MSAALGTETPPVSSVPIWKQPMVRRLLVIALLAEIGYAVLNISSMPVYLAADPGSPHKLIPEGRGLGASVIGFVLVAFLFSEAVFKGPMGALADRFGHRKLMLIGPCITTCTALLTLIVPYNSGAMEVALLLLLRTADGIGAAMLWPAAFALMGETVGDDQRQQAMSFLNLCYMLGIALALPIGGVADDWSSHKWASLFLASVVFAGVALAVFRFIPHEDQLPHFGEHSETPAEAGFKDLLHAVRQIPAYLILAFVTFIGIGFPMAIIKLFALTEFQMGESSFGCFVVLPACLGMAVFSVPLSRYGEKIGKSRAVHVGMALCVVGLVIASSGAFVPVLRAPWVLALGGLPLGAGFLLAIPAWMASVSDIDPQKRGSNIGAVMTAQGLGAIIGAPLGSTLYEKLAPITGTDLAHYSPFLGCTACVTCGWVLSLRLLRGSH
ncbi:MAG TPA: MFS transporter [Fimbriimonas sp.]|nr:MFS transporter [Fimbriimonas sp.]